jgi:tetratricopeptide (TPR) repeat protein
MATYNQGLVQLMSASDREKALDYFLKADALEKGIFEVTFQIGKLYLEMEKPETAREYLQKASAIRPSSGITQRYLGNCCEALNLTEAAVSAYKKAVKHNPNDPDALSNLGFLLEKTGESTEIVETFYRHSVAIAKENGLFRYRLAMLHFKEGKLEKALAGLRKAQDLGHDCSREIDNTLQLLDTETVTDTFHNTTHDG